MTEKTCSVCNRNFSLNDNLAGLVFNNKHFVCEDCCTNKSDDDVISSAKTTMQSSQNGMPIVLWLIHEQNKNKPLMSSKK